MRYLTVLAIFCLLCTVLLAQKNNDSDSTPTLEHFNPDQIDHSIDPCSDFFQYACHKWIEANPIPADQAGSGTFQKLFIWNTAAVHDTLEDAAKAPNRTPAEQKAGDYYASCMDEAAINRQGITPLQPELDRIARLEDKSQLPEMVASIHQIIRPANLNFIDAQYQGVLFGIYAIPDFNDATMMVPALDQSGMGMPSREFYLNDDAKSKEIRANYVNHITKMLELSGETEAQAAKDADSVLGIETGMAKAAMDIVARRDPKNQNNKMTLEQVQGLTSSFSWSHYFAAMHAPMSASYLVLAPDFFRGMNTLIVSEPVDHWRAYLRYSVLRSMAPFLK